MGRHEMKQQDVQEHVAFAYLVINKKSVGFSCYD